MSRTVAGGTRRVLVNDFPGYPYPAELSRELAQRGFDVMHAWCPSITTTPTGHIAARADDPASLNLKPLPLARPLNKHSLIRRFFQEREYGARVAELIRHDRPEVVLSANCPLDAHPPIMAASRASGARFVYWAQDLLGFAARRVLRERVPVAGDWIGRRYERMEFEQLHRSDAVIVLSDDFVPILVRAGVDESAITTIENWAPLRDLPTRPRHNGWSQRHGYNDKFTFVYAGSLGMKHSPELLVSLASAFSDDRDVRVVVLSQGRGADYVRRRTAALSLHNLDVLDFAAFDDMPDVMGGADVLVAILEEAAGVYSVPSKVLAYMCAARPVLASIPESNLAARILSRENAGLTVPPPAVDKFVQAAKRLRADASLRDELGRNARRYAEAAFPIEAVADRFENVIISKSVAP